QTASTVEGSASAMDIPDGAMIAVSVRLASPGRYDVFMLDRSRHCDETKEWAKPLVRTPAGANMKSDKWNLGIMEVKDLGTGELSIRIPANALIDGARSLEGRPIVIFEGINKPVSAKRAVACGVIRSGQEQPVG